MALVTTILMATGKVGKSTVETLMLAFKGKVTVRAGTRNPDKVDEALKKYEDVKFVKAYVGGDKEDMQVNLSGCLFFTRKKLENEPQRRTALRQRDLEDPAIFSQLVKKERTEPDVHFVRKYESNGVWA